MGVGVSKESTGLFVAGAGADRVAPNAPGGANVVSNVLPFVGRLGPGSEGSCPGASGGDVPSKMPAIVGCLSL